MAALLDGGQWALVGLVALAMALGGAIGLERQLARKPAGLRTNMLVAGAAALLVGVAPELVKEVAAAVGAEPRGLDPLRIMGAVVSGVSFLGAGTILRRQGDIQGLTTAASLLMSAAVGLCVGVRQVGAAIGTTALVVLVLRVGSLEDEIEDEIDPKRRRR